MPDPEWGPVPVEQIFPGDEIRFEIRYVPPPAQDPSGEGTTVVYDTVRSVLVRGREYWLTCSESVVAVYRRGERVSAKLR